MRLRQSLASDHDRVDRAFGGFDLGTTDGFACCLLALRAGFAAMPRTPEGIRDDVLARLAADLSDLGNPTGPVLRPLRIDPVAADYVMQGSRSGTEVMRRRWSGAALVANSAYFAPARAADGWTRLTRALSAEPGHGPRADRIVEDARRAFGAFLDAAVALSGRDAA